MKELLRAVVLENRATKAFEPAELYRELDRKNFEVFEKLWNPMIESRLRHFPSWADAAAGDAQDSHWEWADKAVKATRSMGQETFGVECAGETQGLMLGDTTQFAK